MSCLQILLRSGQHKGGKLEPLDIPKPCIGLEGQNRFPWIVPWPSGPATFPGGRGWGCVCSDLLHARYSIGSRRKSTWVLNNHGGIETHLNFRKRLRDLFPFTCIEPHSLSLPLVRMHFISVPAIWAFLSTLNTYLEGKVKFSRWTGAFASDYWCGGSGKGDN